MRQNHNVFLINGYDYIHLGTISDGIWIPYYEKHWQDATATTAMTHIAIQEHLDGKTADWMEKVSDGQYLGKRKRQQKASLPY